MNLHKPSTETKSGSPMSSPMGKWLAFKVREEENRYKIKFHDQLIGNPIIRSVHGGATASLIEMSAAHALVQQLGEESSVHLVSSSIDYLRVTKDVDVEARAQIQRISRRLAFVDVWCWQDAEDIPIARGTCTLRIMRQLRK